jgi:hypothetical protein
MIINGKEVAWSNIQLLIMGVPVKEVSSISYSKNRTKTNNYGIGSNPVSRTSGNVECSASITLHASAIEAITNAAPEADLTLIPFFDIKVMYIPSNGGEIYVHTLKQCEFLSNGREVSQNDALVEQSFDLILDDIIFEIK